MGDLVNWLTSSALEMKWAVADQQTGGLAPDRCSVSTFKAMLSWESQIFGCIGMKILYTKHGMNLQYKHTGNLDQLGNGVSQELVVSPR